MSPPAKRTSKYFKVFTEVVRSHYHFAVSNRGHRDLGIILAVSGWILMAFFFIFKEYLPMETDPITEFTYHSFFMRFTALFMSMTLFFLVLCLLKNMGRHMKFSTMLRHSFKCEKVGYVILRSVISLLSIYALTLAIAWDTTVDNSILFITDAMWIVIILWCGGIKVNKISVFGIFLATGVIFITYFQNMIWGGIGGFSWGMTSGIALAVVTVLTSYLVEHVPTRILGLYQAICGVLISCLLAMFSGFIEGFDPIGIDEFVSLALFGITFSVAVYSIIRALHYLETYIMGVMTFFFHISMEGLRFIYDHKLPSQVTIFGIVILMLAAIIILFSIEVLPNKHKKLYKVSKE